jgi:hypothetical protein
LKKPTASGSGFRDEQPGSYFLELRNHFFLLWGLKYLNSLMRIRDPGWRQFGSGIRDGKKSDPGSGINIPDPPHWFKENKYYIIFYSIQCYSTYSVLFYIIIVQMSRVHKTLFEKPVPFS